MIKVDLGAGHLSANKIDRYKRYLGDDYNPSDYLKIDLQVVEGVDEICDFETEKLPLSENSVNEIVTIHTLEHIHNLEHIIKECHRVLKPNCSLKIWVPHCNSTVAFAEPSHVRFFSVSTFDNYDVRARDPEPQKLGIFFKKMSAFEITKDFFPHKINIFLKFLSKINFSISFKELIIYFINIFFISSKLLGLGNFLLLLFEIFTSKKLKDF